MSTSARTSRGTISVRSKVVLALYVLAAALLPLGHHDLACHLKSTTHCTTCIIGSSAEAAVDSAVAARFWLRDLGATTIDAVQRPVAADTPAVTGRAPPSFA